MREFILKLKRLEGRQRKTILALRKHYKIAQAMIDFQNFSQFQSQSRVEQEKDMQTLLNTFSEGIESQQGQDFFQDDNDVPKKRKMGNPTTTAQKLKHAIYKQMFHIEDISKRILIMQALLLTFYHF